MSGSCIHGLDPADCLICRTLAADPRPTVTAEATGTGLRHREVKVSPSETSAPIARAGRAPSPSLSGNRRRHHGPAGSLLLVLVVLLAIGAATWILAGTFSLALHVFELVAVAVGAGWVGYRIGHFRGSRHSPKR